MKINCSRTLNYRSFGFIPSGSFKIDLYKRVFGQPNLLKRLQMPDLIQALDIKSDECVLDFGCGMGGYITVELAKLAKEATGIDISNVETLKIPEHLTGKLKFIQVSGTGLPFSDSHFDVVLASEVLPMANEPDLFLKEIFRVLKPGGKLVVLNGLDRPIIRDLYERKSWLIATLKRFYKERVPTDCDDYVTKLLASAGTAVKRFMRSDEIEELLVKNGYRIDAITYTPSRIAGNLMSLEQYIMFVISGKCVTLGGFFWKFPLLNLIQKFDKEKSRFGLGHLVIAFKPEI